MIGTDGDNFKGTPTHANNDLIVKVLTIIEVSRKCYKQMLLALGKDRPAIFATQHNSRSFRFSSTNDQYGL